jgi:hypothetical protein
MNRLDYKLYYHRHLPHILPPDSTFFVTFRLIDSIPKSVVRSYQGKIDWLENETTRVLKQEGESPLAIASLSACSLSNVSGMRNSRMFCIKRLSVQRG